MVQHSMVVPGICRAFLSPPVDVVLLPFFVASRPFFRIPADIEYTHERLPSMSSEELEKLNLVRPETFAAASQMQGITPHSLVYLYNHVTRRSKVQACRVCAETMYSIFCLDACSLSSNNAQTAPPPARGDAHLT